MTRLAWLSLTTLCMVPLLFLVLPWGNPYSGPFAPLMELHRSVYDSHSVFVTNHVYLTRSSDSRVRLTLAKVLPSHSMPVKDGFLHAGFFDSKGVQLTGMTASYSNRAIDHITIVHIPNLHHDFSQKYYEEVRKTLPKSTAVCLVTNTP